jgi:indole-3-glycerol phosphate synthase
MSVTPLQQLQSRGGPEQRPSFFDAIERPGVSLIAEVKRASPSRGPIRQDLDVADVVKRYEAAGASAISVLTEEDHFRGSLADLAVAVEATRLPVLRKDFVIDEYQLHEACVLGASAVLLIASILRPEELSALGGTAANLGLDVLVEVHDEEELERALGLDRAVVGINNRDLATLRVDLETTFRLICRVPPERLVVSESGIRSVEDFSRICAAGVDGVLIGEHLVASGDVETTVRELLSQPPSVSHTGAE